MIYQTLSFSTPLENILYDDVLLHLAEQGEGGEVLRLWESPEYFIVLGRTGKPQDDVLARPAAEDHIPVLRRSSGGGTVVQGPGCLNYTLVMSKERDPRLNDIRQSYRVMLEGVMTALARLGFQTVFRPTSDLACAGSEKKFSGNAQRRSRRFILQHGTLLYAFDLALISRYLAMPRDIPEYRQGRPHADFVINLPFDPAAFLRALRDTYHLPESPQPLLPLAEAALKDFLRVRGEQAQIL